MKRRHHYFSSLQQNLISKREYNSFRNKVNNLIRKSKKVYYHQLFSRVKNDVKRTSISINEVLKSNPSNNKSAVISIVFNFETYSDELEVIQKFNEHFSNIAKKIYGSIPIVTARFNFVQYLADILSHVPFRFASVSATANKNAIMSLKKNCYIFIWRTQDY